MIAEHKIKPTTAIVIPNWNGADMIGACIDSLLTQTVPVTIVVVENGSVDNSMDVLKMYGDKIVILPQKRNLGFAGGVNRGIEYALEHDYTYVGLLNNDAVADSRWVEELLKGFGVNDNIGIVTGKLLKDDKKTIDSAGDFYTRYGLPFPRGRNEIDKGQYDSSDTVFGASGGASLYSGSMLRNIGLFDESFFAYLEDVDISFRAQLFGYKVFFMPKALVYHATGSTSKRIPHFGHRQMAQNFWLLYIKNVPGMLFLKLLPYAFYWYSRMFAARVIKGGFWSFVRGWIYGLLLLPKAYKNRRMIQKNRKVSVYYINSLICNDSPSKL